MSARWRYRDVIVVRYWSSCYDVRAISVSSSFRISRWRPRNDKTETQKRWDNAKFTWKNTTFKASLKTVLYSCVYQNQKTLTNSLESISRDWKRFVDSLQQKIRQWSFLYRWKMLLRCALKISCAQGRIINERSIIFWNERSFIVASFCVFRSMKIEKSKRQDSNPNLSKEPR